LTARKLQPRIEFLKNPFSGFGCVFAVRIECRDRRNLIDVFSIVLGVLTETECSFLVKLIDEEIKKLVFVYGTV
jgi:hypothetical protein